MEYIGKNKFSNLEYKIRMPKFGTIINEQCSSNSEYISKRETVITTKLRDFSRENITAAEKKRGIARPQTNIRQAIFDLLRLHPSPRYCGPFTGPINGVWEEAARNMVSRDREKKFHYFVTFTHAQSQPCRKWTLDDDKTTTKLKPEFAVELEEISLAGPASEISKNIIYPCEHGKCCIHCPCNLCTSSNKPCNQYCASHPCVECDKQCLNHQCRLDRTYSNQDSFTIPFYCDILDEDAISEERNSLLCYDPRLQNPYDPEYDFIKYAGIPRDCSKCQIDLLDHEIHHHVLHYCCKFCRKSLRIIRNNPIDIIQLIEEKKKIKRIDDTTCSFCYKLFKYPSGRIYHESTEHTLNEKPYKCQECPQSFASLVAKTHHQIKHKKTNQEYTCNVCKEIFNAERTLKRHIKSIHENQTKEELQCEECDNKFTRIDNLKRHLQEIHRISTLNINFIRKLKNNLFECNYCDASFGRKQTLNDHILSSHDKLDSDSLQCALCSKTFVNVRNKIRHVSTVHEKLGEEYKCKYCEKKFGRKDNLTKHVKQFHTKSCE